MTPRLTPAPPHTATIMRTIGQRRHAHTHTRGHFLCNPCKVAWTGAEADCWNCGRPATTEYGHRGAALQQLLRPTRPTSEQKTTPQ